MIRAIGAYQVKNYMEIPLAQSEIQDRLNAFYMNALEDMKVAGCFTELQQRQLSGPFLLHVPENYFKAPVRIMFVGQETAGWVGKLHGTFQHADPVKPSLDRYAKQLRMQKWESAFFKKYRLMEQRLGHGARGTILWNNLFKMDVDRGPHKSRNALGFSAHLDAFSEKLFRYEVALLQPDVMIFACGPAHDKVIKQFFPSYSTTEIVEPRSLWHFTIGATRCYRTWHPRTIKYSGKHPIAWYFQRIIEDVQKNHPVYQAKETV
jgi:hypothetical protein